MESLPEVPLHQLENETEMPFVFETIDQSDDVFFILFIETVQLFQKLLFLLPRTNQHLLASHYFNGQTLPPLQRLDLHHARKHSLPQLANHPVFAVQNLPAYYLVVVLLVIPFQSFLTIYIFYRYLYSLMYFYQLAYYI